MITWVIVWLNERVFDSSIHWLSCVVSVDDWLSECVSDAHKGAFTSLWLLLKNYIIKVLQKTVHIKSLVEGKPLVLHKASKNKMKNKMFSNSGLPESFSGLDVTESIRTKKNKFY